jgi:LPXTG-motif cell wall-anchored protein
MRILACAVILGFHMPLLGEEIVHRFQAGDYNDELFSYTRTSKQFIRPEDEGLHWHYGDGKAPAKPMGVHWRYAVRGDFAITAQYELLWANRPDGADGVGIELFMVLANSQKDGISVARTRCKDGPRLQFLHKFFDESGNRASKELKSLGTTPASDRGRLRFERDGSTLIVSLAEGDQKYFKELHRAEIGTSDVEMIRFAGLSAGDHDAQLDMRLVEFRLQGDQLLKKGTIPATEASSTGWLVWGIGALFLGLGAFLFFQRRKLKPAR